jgi:FkbM family methyltransferase
MNFKTKIKSFLQRQLDYQKYEKKSFSQNGEDLIISTIFQMREIEKPSFLDVGANHPFEISNTFLIYLNGGRGYNIDANPKLLESFMRFRPEDVNLNLGVGSVDGVLDFYVFDYSGLSTFNQADAEVYQKLGKKLAKVIQIQVVRLNSIVEKYCNGVFPDLLSIDVEGMDFQIFNSLDFSRSKPKVICIETVEYSTDGRGKKEKELIELIHRSGFTIFADTYVNSIFVENEFWFGSK